MDNKTSKQTKALQPDQEKGLVRSVRVSVNREDDYRGEKNYRTVYGIGELENLYVDTEIFNREYAREAWEAVLTIRLFRLENQKAVCVCEKTGKIKIEKEDSILVFEEMLQKAELKDQLWNEGVYRVLADVNGIAGQSDDIYVIGGNGRPEEYFRLLHAGLDRCCEESEVEAQKRLHSYQIFDINGLQNIRFFLMAQNLTGKEWVYEFMIRVLNKDGSIRVMQIVKSAQFIKDQSGGSILCFAIDLGERESFVETGEYTVSVSCFGQLVLSLGFVIGAKDVPYDFEQEVLADGGEMVVKPKLTATYSVKDRDEIMDRLYRLVGLRKVKEEITQIMDYAEFVRLRRENGFGDVFPQMHLVFTGHPGTGKNTVAEMIGELYQKLGLLKNGRVNHYGRRELVREGTSAEEQLVRQAVKNSTGGILFIDQAGDFFQPEDQNDRGIVALGILFNILTRENPEVLVILADVGEEIDTMMEALPDLQRLFSRRLCFEDYTPEELMEITRYKLEKLEYRFTPAAEEKFFKQLKLACRANEVDFTNGRYIDEQIEQAAVRMSRRLMANRSGEYKKEDLMLITDEDILAVPEGDPGKSLEKLNAMIGLGNLKSSIVQHLNYVYFIRERQKHGFADTMPPLNMIFCGNPGTGKMTVAKMMGEIYHAVGILSRPGVVVQDARNFMTEGGVAPQQAAEVLMNMAAGGILYIDHADVLPQNEFGLAFFEALLSEISLEECGDAIVILGGYPDRVDKMMEMNPALKNYFPYTFMFNDYTPEELMQIAENKLTEKNYVFHPKAKEMFAELIRKAYENRNKNFGNALLVEKIVDMAIRNMSERTMKIRQERELTRQEITTIRKDDIPVNIFDMPKFDRDVFDEEEIGKTLEELDKMVGQNGIKKQIQDFVELARHYSREGVKLSSRMSLQWCFTGNSAMGKGTVARIIARLYKAMGIINSGQVLDFKVERMIGLMEDEAQRSIGEALMKSNGGILLFDEDSPKLNEASGFRERVRAILMNQMAVHPGSFIIIYAEPKHLVAGMNGDAEHMSELLNVLVFEDYTKEELMVILKRRLDKERMKMTTIARRYMVAFIGSLVSTEERSHSSSRLMRIVADLIVRNCLQRIAKTGKIATGEIISVQKQDVTMFTEQFVAGLMNERKRIGFV